MRRVKLVLDILQGFEVTSAEGFRGHVLRRHLGISEAKLTNDLAQLSVGFQLCEVLVVFAKSLAVVLANVGGTGIVVFHAVQYLPESSRDLNDICVAR